MRMLVTGAAGFIGSRLVERLLADGHTVRGIDCFSSYYALDQKKANVVRALQHDRYRLDEIDLRTAELEREVHDVDVVFHLAAQPGVRRSWDGFGDYLLDNVLSTQRLLHAASTATNLQRFVNASSSSVYGESAAGPTTEASPARPRSPYGVTKLACEDLCAAYAEAFGVPTVSLRYFTVYGPRQRPDMAIHRMCEAALRDISFPLYGDGSASRSFTYVDDVVDATVRAASASLSPGAVCNVAGTDRASVAELIDTVGDLSGRRIAVESRPAEKGDVRRTDGDTHRALAELGWHATTSLRDGLRAQLEWHRARFA